MAIQTVDQLFPLVPHYLMLYVLVQRSVLSSLCSAFVTTIGSNFNNRALVYRPGCGVRASKAH